MTFGKRKIYWWEVWSKLMKTILPILNKDKIQTKVNREMNGYWTIFLEKTAYSENLKNLKYTAILFLCNYILCESIPWWVYKRIDFIFMTPLYVSKCILGVSLVGASKARIHLKSSASLFLYKYILCVSISLDSLKKTVSNLLLLSLSPKRFFYVSISLGFNSKNQFEIYC